MNVSKLASVFQQKSHSRSTEAVNIKSNKIPVLNSGKPVSADHSRRHSVFKPAKPIPVTQNSIGAHPNNPLRIAVLGGDGSGKSAFVCKMTTGRFIHSYQNDMSRIQNLCPKL